MAAKQGSISLVDNTNPSESPTRIEITQTISNPSLPSVARHFTRGSVRNGLAQRKYAKWKRERVRDDTQHPVSRERTKDTVPSQNGGSGSDVASNESEDRRRDAAGATTTTTTTNDDDSELLNIVPTQTTTLSRYADPDSAISELDVLYENQRGLFFFGIPFYSQRSLLHFDPSAWVTKDYNDSPVDITNAQVPDPSWEWAWQSWFVDMSGDVDEEGWQYSFSFGLKCGWHGTHPWFHSHVRRRRWVRLRTKKKHARGRSGATVLESAHRLNEDYFTIHSQNAASRDPSVADPTLSRPVFVTRHGAGALPEESLVEQVEDIPTLLQALKDAIIDREKVDILRRFLAQGGEELFYLADRVPEILSLFVFQTSRWQFLKLLRDNLDQASRDEPPKTDVKEAEAKRRRQDNLSRAIDVVNRQIAEYDVFDVTREKTIRTGGGFGPHPSKASPGKTIIASQLGEIRGIPEAAKIGKEGHIY